MTTWMKVSEIIRNVKESYDYGDLDTKEDWRGMLKWKLSDEQSVQLIREIQQNGFTTPIYLDDVGDNRCILGNGHHRLSVAILLGLDKVLTTNSSGESGFHENVLTSYEDVRGAKMLADMVDTAIDWENWT